MRMLLRCVFVSAMISVGAPTARAEIVPYFPFTGRLTDASGEPLGGSLIVTFSFFDAEASGVELWQQAYTVYLTEGRLSVALGSDTDAASLPVVPLVPEMFDGPTYLEVKVGNDPPLAPRLAVGAMAYAMRARVAEDVECAGCVINAAIADGAVSDTKISFGYAASVSKGGAASAALVSNDVSCSGCITGSEIASDTVQSGNVSFGYAASVTKGGAATDVNCSGCVGTADIADNACTDAKVADAISIDNGRLFAPAGAGNVGIGTTVPAASLDVGGTGAIRIPVGTTAERPASSTAGMLRFNSTTNKLEYFNGTTWSGIGGLHAMTCAAAEGGDAADYSAGAQWFVQSFCASRYGGTFRDDLSVYDGAPIPAGYWSQSVIFESYGSPWASILDAAYRGSLVLTTADVSGMASSVGASLNTKTASIWLESETACADHAVYYFYYGRGAVVSTWVGCELENQAGCTLTGLSEAYYGIAAATVVVDGD